MTAKNIPADRTTQFCFNLQLEDQPHNTIAFQVIGEFLYGNTSADVSEQTDISDKLSIGHEA